MLEGSSLYRCEQETCLGLQFRIVSMGFSISVMIKQVTCGVDFGPGDDRSHSFLPEASTRPCYGYSFRVSAIQAAPLFQVCLVIPLYSPHADFSVQATSTCGCLCSWNFCSYQGQGGLLFFLLQVSTYLVLSFSGHHS